MTFAFDFCVKQLKFLETLMFELSCRVHLGQSPGEDPVLNSEESRSLGRSVATTGRAMVVTQPPQLTTEQLTLRRNDADCYSSIFDCKETSPSCSKYSIYNQEIKDF